MPETRLIFSQIKKKEEFNVHEKHLSCTEEAEPVIRLFIISCAWYQTHGVTVRSRR